MPAASPSTPRAACAHRPRGGRASPPEDRGAFPHGLSAAADHADTGRAPGAYRRRSQRRCNPSRSHHSRVPVAMSLRSGGSRPPKPESSAATEAGRVFGSSHPELATFGRATLSGGCRWPCAAAGAGWKRAIPRSVTGSRWCSSFAARGWFGCQRYRRPLARRRAEGGAKQVRTTSDKMPGRPIAAPAQTLACHRLRPDVPRSPQ
ncbi:hypothetical protein FHT17_001937 [Novosphingobium sp. SG916]|nr:hypothetical protein [Novosphingobium sp. SG919]NMN87067.1 hypothetical protein [Novosphingobium sp. SG916]